MAFLGADFEYAAHTLLNMDLAQGAQLPSARDLAAFQKIPLAFVRKLLTRMEHAGLVVGEEGRHGGWRLRTPARSISLLDVAEAVREREPLFACREIRARCALWDDASPPRVAVTGRCAIHASVITAERAMRDQLARQTIGSLADAVRSAHPTYAATAVRGWFADQAEERHKQKEPETLP